MSAMRITSAAETPSPSSKVRLGLCCQFVKQPIQFRTTTATSLSRMKPTDRRHKLSSLCLANAESLLMAIRYCAQNGIGCFRIGSSILPVKTHPQFGYSVEDLPESDMIVAAFRRCRELAVEYGIRTVFHPDQYVVLNSPRRDVVEASMAELEYHAEVAEWVGADVINIHGGGAYNDKTSALKRFARILDRLSDAVQSRLTVENDDTVYAPLDLLPFCQATGVPLVYDVHHHRCLTDGLTIEQTTDAALSTWRREPLFHISSPLEGWNGPKPRRHHDYIDISDFPECWRQRRMTVEVEAKAKELAVLRLRNELNSQATASSRRPARSGANR